MPDVRDAPSAAVDLAMKGVTRVAQGTRAHPRMVLAAAGSVLAGAVALVLGRRTEEVPLLPDAVDIAGDTARAVFNAAKGAVISAVGEVDAPTEVTVLEAVRLGVVEAATAGADVTAAALGGVDGAVAVADLVGVGALTLARRAAEAARIAAGGVGPSAAVRVRDALEALTED